VKDARHIFFPVLFLLIVIVSMIMVSAQTRGLLVTTETIDDIPVTVLQKPGQAPSPAIVIAHGFSGSSQLMAPLATTLAQNGYIAVVFDFSGHGRNLRPMSGGLGDLARSTSVLLADIHRVVAFARTLPGVDGRIALAGHSMATDLIVRAARRDPTIDAVIVLSFFSQEVTAQSPRNLLVIDGSWESRRLIDVGLNVVSEAAGGPARPGVTYGDVATGSGRRLALARDAEHIGVLYSHDALVESVSWLNTVFSRAEYGFVDRRGKWLALLFAGLIMLARPLAGLLPVLASTPLGAGLSWRRLAPRAMAPALLTPVILWKVPVDFMPLLLGDYLTLHLGLYGALTAAGLWIDGKIQIRLPLKPLAPVVACAMMIAGYYILVLGVPLDAYVVSFTPTVQRATLILPIFIGCASYFLSDEWMTRGRGAAPGGYFFSKFCFVASLGIAVALNPRRLFFLIIIAIVVIILLSVYGLVGHWVYARTRDPRPGALGAALALAWAIAVCFPIVD
jgi:pimeloyl-ACP methyl ester carboxylesterase